MGAFGYSPRVPNDDLIIRRGGLRDAVTIAAYNIRMALETEQKRLDPYTVSAGVRAVIEDDSLGHYFVADIGGRVIGQLMVTFEWSDWRNGSIWWVQSVYVHPEFRKTGVFRRLLAGTVAAARAAGAVMVRLYVENDNTIAQTAYARLGLEKAPYAVMEMPLPKE
jgi:GNAT superfamily N-acetyltransferase